MKLPANFLDELRARTPLPALVGRSVRLQRSGREHKGCCPFHAEKTPSFYVYDDHFHCFGCGEHGDAITFVMKSQGASFTEAVRSLAAEAGLEMPRASPEEAERETRRAGIQAVLAAAARLYQAWLFGGQGAAGLEYLRGRGLAEATIREFGLGWSGEGRGALALALQRQGIAVEQLVEAGLMKPGDHGPVDMFFSRVMFPIENRQGEILSFSGRILGDGQPKYVNGPETPVFSKRRSLYGLAQARAAVRTGEPLIVVEGQMDVITLSQAGFAGAVAPLGTALTEEQLAELWRLSPEPVLCFDADNAGRRAALRAVTLALGGLKPDRSLKLLHLPEGQDPDSLIRAQGKATFATLLAAAKPVSAVLYDMLAEGAPRQTPEARAAFRERLLQAAGQIADRGLAAEYRSALLARFYAERRVSGAGQRGRPGGAGIGPKPARPIIEPAAADAERARGLTAILITHPQLFAEIEEAFALLDLPPPCARLRAAFSDFHDGHDPLDSERLLAHFHQSGLADDVSRVLAATPLPSCADPGASLAEAADRWWELFNLMRASRNRLREQRDEQHRRYLENPRDAEIMRRLTRLNAALLRAETGERGEDP